MLENMIVDCGAAQTAFLFIEGIPGHVYLYDLYGELPGTHLVTFPADSAWSTDCRAYEAVTDSIGRAISPATKALFLVTLDQHLYNPERFLQFVEHCGVRIVGILHRMPRGPAEIVTVQNFQNLGGRVCFLSKAMTEHAQTVLKLTESRYLPHQATTVSFESVRRVEERQRGRTAIGVKPDQVVFSLLGEARIGKGIDLVLDAWAHIPPKVRSKMFFLFAGKATDYHASDIRAALRVNEVSGLVDLRCNDDANNYAVLSDREYACYVALSDVGLLLYQSDQRFCMSGVLGDYVWANKPVIATKHSFIGAEIQLNKLGEVIENEAPEDLVATLVEMVTCVETGGPQTGGLTKYRAEIAPQIVLRELRRLLEGAPHVKSTEKGDL